MLAPAAGTTWVALTAAPLPVGEVAAWAVQPGCGALVLFSGTVRDHSDGRPGVVELTYEAYGEQVEPRLEAVGSEARRRWPGVGRIALLHRAGTVPVGEAAVVVAVSAPHRDAAFAAARWCIDTLKETVPIWKRERWADGDAWAVTAHAVTEAAGRSGP